MISNILARRGFSAPFWGGLVRESFFVIVTLIFPFLSRINHAVLSWNCLKFNFFILQVTGRKADALMAAHLCSEAALRLCKLGNEVR